MTNTPSPPHLAWHNNLRLSWIQVTLHVPNAFSHLNTSVISEVFKGGGMAANNPKIQIYGLQSSRRIFRCSVEYSETILSRILYEIA